MKNNIELYILLFLYMCFCICESHCAVITPERALKIAQNFLLQNEQEEQLSGNNFRKEGVDNFLIDTFTVQGRAYMYKVTSIQHGWALISMESSVAPILAYSYNDTLPNMFDMPDGMKYLLTYYENIIKMSENESKNNVEHIEWKLLEKESVRTRGENVVLPLLGYNEWGQSGNNTSRAEAIDKCYNKNCHRYDSCNTILGCGAVALGQVMWYYKWPHSAKISSSYSLDSGEYSSDFRIAEYDWNLMPACIYSDSMRTTDAEIEMTSSFLRDCGFATEMEYGCNGSLTYLSKIKKALASTFHYKEISLKYKSQTPNWADKIKNEIDNNRPVIYRGGDNTIDSGHFFVIYGYQGNHFHINWGWRGTDNSILFKLDSLWTSNGSYNDGHSALFGIEPDYPDCDLYSLKNNDISDTQFEVYNGGAITASNKTINSNQSGVIYSGRAVYISSPFEIKRGANVHIAIRNMNCDLRANTRSPVVRSAPAKTDDIGNNVINSTNSMCLFPNPAQTRITVSVVGEIGKVFVFNLNGQQVLQTELTDIDVSGLPQGMYILRAQTTDGSIYQGKFVKIVR